MSKPEKYASIECMFDSMSGESQEAVLADLRGRMAAISGHVGAASGAGISELDVIGVAGALGELLPGGGLARGSAVSCPRGVVLAGLLASATGQGGQPAAVIGGARLGLLAVAEMGGQLSRLHVVDVVGRGDPVEVASVLLDGVPVVVLDVDVTIPPPRWRGLAAKLRNHKGVLIVTSGVRGVRADLDIQARPTEFTGLRAGGGGRVREVHLAVEVTARRAAPRTGQLTVAPRDGRVGWTPRARPAVEPHRQRVIAG